MNKAEVYAYLNIFITSLIVSLVATLFSTLLLRFLRNKFGTYNSDEVKDGQLQREFWGTLITFLVVNSGLYIMFHLKVDLGLRICYRHFKILRFLYSFFGVFLWSEFQYYFMHRLIHSKKFWKIHQLHHESRRVTLLSAFSFSPLEILLVNFLLPFPFVILAGKFISVSFWGILLYDLFGTTLGTMWLHSNIRFPERFERILNKILIVTPKEHQDHHLRARGNFGLFTRIPDKIFKTRLK